MDRVFAKQWEKLPDIARVTCTFLTINYLWVLFRAESMRDAIKIYKGMFDFGNVAIGQLAKVGNDGTIGFPLVVFVAIIAFFLVSSSWIVFTRKNVIEKSAAFEVTSKSAIFTVAVFFIALIHMSRISPFIYFNF